MTILVTGSAGHLGEALMRTLRAQGQPAFGIDLKPSPFTDCVGSITDMTQVREVMQGVKTVFHAATLHKPHIATHAMRDFVDTNVTGTLTLLEAAAAAGVRSFIFTSTTSTFGSALTPATGEPAAWVTEDVAPVPKNIYGTSKLMAEQLCELFCRRGKFPVVILRTSRFFPEEDDNPDISSNFHVANAQANELAYRRLDIEDAVSAHLAAAANAPTIGFGRYIVSATSPFSQGDLAALRSDAAGVLSRLFPNYEKLFEARGWQFFSKIDRIYVNDRARRELGWSPRIDFAHVLGCLEENLDFRSQMALDVGCKGYHDTRFEEGPYPVLA
jgi:UDP-glucose 4-epimerase